MCVAVSVFKCPIEKVNRIEATTAKQIQQHFCKGGGAVVKHKYPLLYFTGSPCCGYRLKYGVPPLLGKVTKWCCKQKVQP